MEGDNDQHGEGSQALNVRPAVRSGFRLPRSQTSQLSQQL